MEQGRRHEVVEPTKQPVLADDDHAPASTTGFTSNGTIPSVLDEVHAPPPSASDRAYGGSKGKGKGKAGKGYDASGVLNSEMRTTVLGVTIVAPAGVHVDAIGKVGELLRTEIGRNQYAQRRFTETRTTIVIIPAKVPSRQP